MNLGITFKSSPNFQTDAFEVSKEAKKTYGSHSIVQTPYWYCYRSVFCDQCLFYFNSHRYGARVYSGFEGLCFLAWIIALLCSILLSSFQYFERTRQYPIWPPAFIVDAMQSYGYKFGDTVRLECYILLCLSRFCVCWMLAFLSLFLCSLSIISLRSIAHFGIAPVSAGNSSISFRTSMMVVTAE